jgi:RNA polymerase sigma-70 factor (ECF subfamily)
MFAGLSEYIDKRVDKLECDRVQRHLQDCPACVAFVNDLSRAVERCKSFETTCQPRTAEKLRKLLMAEYKRFSNRPASAAS